MADTGPTTSQGTPTAMPAPTSVSSNGAGPARPPSITTAFHEVVPTPRVLTSPPADGGVAKTPEPAPEAPKPAEPAPAEKPDAKRFAALAREAKAIREQKEEIKRMREEIRREYQDLQELKQLKAMASTDPLAYLKAGGLTYDQLTARMLQGGQPDPHVIAQAAAAEVEQRVADKVSRLEEAEKRRAEAQQAEMQRQVQDYEAGAVEFVKAAAEKYELTNLFNAQHEVPGVIKLVAEQTFRETGTPRILSYEEAADMVEKHFEEQATRYTSSKKYQAKVEPAAPSTGTVPSPSQGTGKANGISAATHTLTNDMTVSSSGAITRNTSEEERVQNALRVAASFKK